MFTKSPKIQLAILFFKITVMAILNKYPKRFALIFGSLMAFTTAPSYIFILGFLSIPMLIILLENSKDAKQAFIFGWLWGMGYFTIGLHWISNALFVDLSSNWWALPFALFGLPVILSLFTAIPAYLLRRSATKYDFRWNTLVFTVGFVVLFSLFEYVRGHIFTGFPWNLFGYTWGFENNISQTVSIVGIYGLSLFTLIGFSVLRFGLKGAMIALFIFGSLNSFGAYRLSNAQLTDSNIMLHVIQPNIAQTDKWKVENRANNLDSMIELSLKSLTLNQTHSNQETQHILIWPETALVDPFSLSPDIQEILHDRIFSSYPNLSFISGGIEIAYDVDAKGVAEKNVFNSAFIYEGERKLWQRYDKTHLVPFGEYVPYGEYLSFMRIGNLGFTKGQAIQDYTINETSIRPLICYEAIFPHYSASINGTRPDLLVNLTNDAWYGESWGPQQHHDHVKFRAIEQGISMVRVANTGISSIITPYGLVLKDIDLEKRGYFSKYMKNHLQNATTYGIYGNIIYILLCALGFGFVATRLYIIRRKVD